MKKRVLGVLLCICMIAVSLSTSIFADSGSNIGDLSVKDAEFYTNGSLKKLKTSFRWGTATADCCLVLMTERLRSAGELGTSSSYGDFTDFGYYGSDYSSFDAVLNDDVATGKFGIISNTSMTRILMGSTSSLEISFSDGTIPLGIDKLYYVYLWTSYNGNTYPDALVCAINVKDGAVKYAVATGRNTYDQSAFDSVASAVKYNVTVTPAANMTRVASSGAETQNALEAAMTPVVYKADSGFCFPVDYSVATVNGIMVRRDSDSQITVLGTPAANAAITLIAPSIAPAPTPGTTPTNTYTVRFDANGGEGTMTDMTVEVDDDVALTKNFFTREGYEFIGWSDTEDGGLKYEDQASVPSATSGDEVVLYAVWVHGTLSNGETQVVGVEANGLNMVAKTEKADVELSVIANAESEFDADQIAIRELGDASKYKYYALTLEKGEDELATSTDAVEIKLPFDLSEKKNIKLLGCYDGNAYELVELDERDDAPYTDGEFYVDTENDCIYIYTSTYETVAVAYDEAITLRPSSGGAASGVVSSRYRVRFETFGADEIESVFVRRNQRVSEPEYPVMEGYVFDGWYIDEECTEEYDFDDRVSMNITLYAKWVEQSEDEPADDTSDEPIDNTTDDIFDDVEPTEPDYDTGNPTHDATHDCPSAAFEDLNLEAWYHIYTDYVLEQEIMRGVSENTFAPDVPLSRAMLVTVLYRSEGEPAVNRSIPFADLGAGAYYTNAVIWAAQNGIVNGISSTEFAPDANITREQLATILYRYAEYKGLDVDIDETALDFDDAAEVSEYALDAVDWACASGILNGRGGGKLCPLDDVTRAEAAAMLHRFIG